MSHTQCIALKEMLLMDCAKNINEKSTKSTKEVQIPTQKSHPDVHSYPAVAACMRQLVQYIICVHVGTSDRTLQGSKADDSSLKLMYWSPLAFIYRGNAYGVHPDLLFYEE